MAHADQQEILTTSRGRLPRWARRWVQRITRRDWRCSTVTPSFLKERGQQRGERREAVHVAAFRFRETYG